jgi:hypothetical protein
MKMFGRLTRETAEWVPARLLCVRFNVKNPFADDKAETGPKKKKAPSFDSAELFSKLDEPRAAAAPVSGEHQPAVIKQSLVTAVEPEEEAVQEKPPMDLFKAIFANSDSESESESEEDEGPQESNRQPSGHPADRGSDKQDIVVEEPSKQRDAPRGIFANIDFDALNRRRRKTPPPLVKEKVAASKPKSALDQSVRTLLGIKNPR